MTAYEMATAYDTLAYTHNYIMGYVYKHMVYMTIVNGCADYMTVDKASSKNGGGMSLRFVPNMAQKRALMALNAEVICAESELEAMVSNSKYNRGEIFEKLITEKYGLTWVKDKNLFTDCGDIEVDHIAYQIKYQKATFTNEATLRDLGWAA